MTAAEKLIIKYKTIRTLPHIVTRLVQLVNDEESALQDFEEVIRMDPALVARLLTLVNSSCFGLTRKVDSISCAVALLGKKNLAYIAVTDAIHGMLRSSSGTTTVSPQNLWLHSAASGICCKMIAERIFSINGDDAYLCGILHDIGLIVAREADKETFLQRIEQPVADGDGPAIVELEQSLFHTDHSEIGYLLTKEWRIPDPIAEAIRDHHLDSGDVVPRSLTGILQMSEYIINQLNFSMKEELPTTLSPTLTSHIQANVEEYRVVAEDLPEEFEKTKNMYGD